MRTLRIVLTLVIILALASLTAVVPKALAGNHAPESCSVELLEGTFAYSGQSFASLTTPALFNPIGVYGPFSLAGTMSFDGKGNVTGVEVINFGSGGLPSTFAGTYTVVDPAAKANECAFTTTFSSTFASPPAPPGFALPPDTLYMVLADHGKVIEFINLNPGLILAFPGTRK